MSEKGKYNSKEGKDKADKLATEEIIARELASQKVLFGGYSADKKGKSSPRINKKYIIYYVTAVALVLLIGLSAGFFFFSSFLQLTQVDCNLRTYEQYLNKIENQKGQIKVSVDSLVSATVARVDSANNLNRRKQYNDSVSSFYRVLEDEIKYEKHVLDKLNNTNVTSYTIPAKYQSRILGQFCKHVIKRGETLRSISLLYYGSKKYSNFIFVYNHDSISAPDDVKYGDVIAIPRIKGVDMKWVE